MYGQVRADIREIKKTLCNYKGVEIIEGAVCIDHVHLCVSIPPKMSVSEFMGYLKGKSALMIYDRHPELQNKWNKAFWARGYYVATIGRVDKMPNRDLTPYEDIYSEIKETLLLSRNQAYSAVNFAMVQAYWQTGRIIVEHEQNGNARADYGKSVLQELSSRLTKDFGKGFSVRTLQQMKKFYVMFPYTNALRS